MPVRELQRRPGLDDEHAPARGSKSLRVVALALVDRQRAVEDDEHLLLHGIDRRLPIEPGG